MSSWFAIRLVGTEFSTRSRKKIGAVDILVHMLLSFSRGGRSPKSRGRDSTGDRVECALEVQPLDGIPAVEKPQLIIRTLSMNSSFPIWIRSDPAGRKATMMAHRFAEAAHRGQRRKISGLPYIVHPLGVAVSLAKCRCGIELIVAGLLHDTVEDTAAVVADIERLFGAAVVRLVTCVTDTDDVKTWRERKKRMLKRFVGCSDDCLLLKCADALDNLRSIRCDLEQHGDSIWRRLRSRAELRWYYGSLAKIFMRRLRSRPGKCMFVAFRLELRRLFP
jgi:hypothetical protein